jgi:antirestriction protein ArdC
VRQPGFWCRRRPQDAALVIAARAIWVSPGRDRADMAATLAHELAHAAVHEAPAVLPRGIREVVAESVAYAACSRFGLDPSLRSAGYVAGWRSWR